VFKLSPKNSPCKAHGKLAFKRLANGIVKLAFKRLANGIVKLAFKRLANGIVKVVL
jgi:hypothetical protein